MANFVKIGPFFESGMTCNQVLFTKRTNKTQLQVIPDPKNVFFLKISHKRLKCLFFDQNFDTSKFLNCFKRGQKEPDQNPIEHE